MLNLQPIALSTDKSRRIIYLDESSRECLESDEIISKVALNSIANFVESYPEFNNLKGILRYFRYDKVSLDILDLAIKAINEHPRIIIVENEANSTIDGKIFITYQDTINSDTLNRIAIDDKGIVFKNSETYKETLRVLQVPLATIAILEQFRSQLKKQNCFSCCCYSRDNRIYEPLLDHSQRRTTRRSCNFGCNRLSNTTRACLTFFVTMATFASIMILFSKKEE